MVTNVANRNPGILAESILTVDQVSDGRVDVAVGGGYYSVEHEALGLDFLDPVGRGDRLREAVTILDEALRGHTISAEGEHFTLREATFRPGPTQSPRPPIWVAAQTSRSLRVAAQHADGVVSLGESERRIEVSLPAFRARMEKLDEICIEEGRDPSTLRRCYFAGWANEPISQDEGVDRRPAGLAIRDARTWIPVIQSARLLTPLGWRHILTSRSAGACCPGLLPSLSMSAVSQRCVRRAEPH